MAIQRVNISNMSDTDIASLLGLTYAQGCMNKEGIRGIYGFSITSNTVYFNYGSAQIATYIDGGSDILSYEKTENTCVFGLNSSTSSEERLNFGYTLGTNLSTGEKVWIYFVVSGATGMLMKLTDNTAHIVKSALTFEDDNAVSMVNYYIPEFNVFCDYLYSLVTYKSRGDYKFNRFKLNDAYYIKPSGNNATTTAPTTRYDVIAVRTG